MTGLHIYEWMAMFLCYFLVLDKRNELFAMTESHVLVEQEVTSSAATEAAPTF